MYRVKKTMEIPAGHSLYLSKPGIWEPMHGHNWIVTVYCCSEELDEDGLVVDFLEIEELIHKKLDHTNLNEILTENPSAENLAKWICDRVQKCYRVDVRECEGNEAVYEKD